MISLTPADLADERAVDAPWLESHWFRYVSATMSWLFVVPGGLQIEIDFVPRFCLTVYDVRNHLKMKEPMTVSRLSHLLLALGAATLNTEVQS